MSDAERVGDRIRDGCGRADRAAFADSLRSERIERRRRLDQVRLDGRDVLRGRDVILVEVDDARLPVFVHVELLVEALTDCLRDRADDLPFGEQRVDDLARVVDGDDLPDARLPRRALDVDGGRVATGRERRTG